MRKITQIIIHYSASDYERQTAKWINKIHIRRGFRKIGYHFFITKNGKVEKGRAIHEIGAHCKGQNRNSIGVCIAAHKVFTIASLRALECLIDYLKQQFPKAKVYGHNEFNPKTLCPGMNIDRFKKI